MPNPNPSPAPSPEALNLNQALLELETWFEGVAVELLEQLPDQETARKLLLTSENELAEVMGLSG